MESVISALHAERARKGEPDLFPDPPVGIRHAKRSAVVGPGQCLERVAR